MVMSAHSAPCLSAAQKEGLEALAQLFFQQSEGHWHSKRRYYTLESGDSQEVESDITVRLLSSTSPELIALTERHQFQGSFVCGAEVTWESQYISPSRQSSTGSSTGASTGATVFGIAGNLLYRDRGFATPEPVTATFRFLGEATEDKLRQRTMVLRSEYQGSVFEEELKLIGNHYRTRQTVISRAGAEIMIGQYLEKRCYR